MSPSFASIISRIGIVSIAITSLAGCSFFRGDGTKQRLDEPREIPHHPVNVKARNIVIAVTTGADGSVINIEFIRSSGSNAVDGYVADNIKHSWPAKPSDRSVVELTYSAAKGFSEPRLISSTPVL